jgi:hypothetical protein
VAKGKLLPISSMFDPLFALIPTGKAQDVICPQWRDMILSLTTDGERKMTTGHVNGVATHFSNDAKPSFFRIWCGSIFFCKHFSSILLMRNSISFLRRQQSLIKEMKTRAKKVANTCWESMSKVTAWFREYRVPIQEYLAEKNPSCTPPLKW